MNATTETLTAAREYVARGFSVIPLYGPGEPAGAPVDKRGKRPAIQSWKEYQTRYATDEELVGWFEDGKRNIGIVTGAISGLTVVDFDQPEAIESATNKGFPKGPLVKTTKGFHAYCKHEPGHRNFQKRADLPGIDLRGEGGYAVAPPSIHAKGKPYTWVKGRGLDDLPLPDAPEWLFAKSDKDKTPITDLYQATPGSRNESLARLLGSWLNDHKGITLPELMDMAGLWNSGLPSPLPPEEVRRTCQSIYDKHHSEAAAAVTGTPSDTPPRLRAVTIHELLQNEFPERESLLHPILCTQSLNMVHAWRGLGKTHFGLGVAYAVASGGSFLKWKTSTPRGVLYLDGEMPGNALQERLAAIIAGNVKEPEPGYFRVVTPDLQEPGSMPDLSTPKGQAAVDALITPETALIVVDNLSCLCRTGRENEAESWIPVQGWALRHRAAGRSILFIHHSGKNGEQRGASKKEDVLDVVLKLKRPVDYEPSQGACFEVIFEKARHLTGEDTTSFEATLTTGEYGDQVWVFKDVTQTTYERVIELANDGLSQSDIATELEINKSTVSRHFRKAKADGKLN